MGIERTSGLGVNNQYGPRVSGGVQGVYETDGANNEFVIDFPVNGLVYKVPTGRGQYVYEIDKTFVVGTITNLTVGGLNILAATAAAPVKLPGGNTGLVAQTGATGGKLIIRYKNVAEKQSLFVDSISLPATSLVGIGSQIQLYPQILPGSADRRVTWLSATPANATVSASGLVTGVAAGTSVITATSVVDGSKVGTTTVTVA